jgi:DNA-binding CsgD family transcriptional regulator
LIYTELGRLDEARAELDDLARDDFKSIVKDGLWSTSIAYLAEVCAVLGDVDRAATIYQLLLPYKGRCIGLAGGATACGTASRYLALMASTMKRFQEAERHFDEALAMSITMGARPEVAHTQYDYATMLLGRAQLGDREHAVDLLRTAITTTEELGMRALTGKISAKICDLSKASAPEPAYPDELTPREVAVLRLIAIGRSNSDIAMALSISNNTVATHVRSILAKTGSANRTEAAAYAVRQGLAKLS